MVQFSLHLSLPKNRGIPVAYVLEIPGIISKLALALKGSCSIQTLESRVLVSVLDCLALVEIIYLTQSCPR